MKKLEKNIAKGVASALKKMLSAEANSNSCLIMSQPKAPEKLVKYRRK